MPNQENFSLVIPAAGLGTRLEQEIPKALVKLNEKTLLLQSLENFLAFKGLIDTIVVAYTPGYLEAFQNACQDFPLPISWVEGADTRARSVHKAIQHTQKSSWVLIHDAARPYTSPKLIQRILESRHLAPAIIPTQTLSDTIKKVKNNKVIATLDRNELVSVQTPQCFKLELLNKAYQQVAWQHLTDESQLAETLAETVYCVAGDKDNLKITYPDDLI